MDWTESSVLKISSFTPEDQIILISYNLQINPVKPNGFSHSYHQSISVLRIIA